MLCIWYAAPKQPDSLSAACRSILFNPSLLYKEKDLLYAFASGFHVKNTNLLCLICLFPPFTETFSPSTNVCSSFTDIINTEVVQRSFTCEEGPTARGSSKICLQTGRNKKLKICHRSIFMTYAPTVDYFFTGAVGTMSGKTDYWCYP